MKMKTFLEIRQQNNPYPTTIDITQAEKEAINSWFDTRYVCDNDKFVSFFQRVLVRDYGRYRELLRIEPHVSKYDWLVQQYNEAQTFEKGNEHRVANGTNSSTSTGQTNSQSGHNDTDNTTATTNSNSTDTGTDTNVVNGNATTSNSGVDTVSRNASEDKTGNTSTSAGGTDVTTSENHDNVKALTRENPMSISYSGSFHIDGSGNNDGKLDWQYPSAQTETDTRGDAKNTVKYGRTDTTLVTDSATQTATDRTTHGKTVTDIKNENATATHTNSTIASDTTKTTATRIGSNSYESNTNNITSDAHNDEALNERQALRQYVTTGRSVDTATLLSQAQSFIMNSSAFQWLYSRLDVCFLGVYNDDESYYNV